MMIVFHAIFLLAINTLNSTPAAGSRHLLIFGREQNERLVEEQLRLLAKADSAVKERDVRITVVNAGGGLYSKYSVGSDQFTVILIGKDGSEKLRTHKVLQPDELFATIDAMPMRKREMERKGRSSGE